MSAEELASITRIPLRSLERLESGQFDGEIDGFVRGFVRTVANALGLDAEDTVSRMLREPVPGARERRTPGRGAKQLFVGVVLLLLLVLSFFVLRSGWRLLLGTASTPASRQVVLWHDPVRALAEARGVELDRIAEIDPGTGAEISDFTDPAPRTSSTSAKD
jgi:cytoskeletal protein RodZ